MSSRKPPACKRCGSPLVCLPCERATREETAAELRRMRERAGIGLREMARRIGRSPTFVWQLENGKVRGHDARRLYLAELGKG